MLRLVVKLTLSGLVLGMSGGCVNRVDSSELRSRNGDALDNIQMITLLKESSTAAVNAVDLVGEKYIVRDAIAWQRLWKKISSNQLVPEVDFSQEIVVGHIAYESKGGAELTITSVQGDHAAIYVNITYEKPDESCAVTMHLTRPVHFIKIPRTDLEIKSVVTQRTRSCS